MFQIITHLHLHGNKNKIKNMPQLDLSRESLSIKQLNQFFVHDTRKTKLLHFTPFIRKYKAVCSKNPKLYETRNNNFISSSTQPKEKCPCAFCWDSLKLPGSRIFTETCDKQKAEEKKTRRQKE